MAGKLKKYEDRFSDVFEVDTEHKGNVYFTTYTNKAGHPGPTVSLKAVDVAKIRKQLKKWLDENLEEE